MGSIFGYILISISWSSSDGWQSGTPYSQCQWNFKRRNFCQYIVFLLSPILPFANICNICLCTDVQTRPVAGNYGEIKSLWLEYTLKWLQALTGTIFTFFKLLTSICTLIIHRDTPTNGHWQYKCPKHEQDIWSTLGVSGYSFSQTQPHRKRSVTAHFDTWLFTIQDFIPH